MNQRTNSIAVFFAIALLLGMGIILYAKNFEHRASSAISARGQIPQILRQAQDAGQASVFEYIGPLRFPQLHAAAARQFDLVEPIDQFSTRITKKPFGVYITPETSPVQPDRWTGYHTGVDSEYEDVVQDVPVSAIADGTIVLRKTARGYGGIIVIRHRIGDATILAVYGHLDPESFLPDTTTRVRKGQQIGILGEGYTDETDGARKHLHFSILRKDTLDIRGYVQHPEELYGWYDPLEFYNN